MTLEFKSRLFPNRHFLLQLVYNPLTCPEAFAPMRTRHSQKKGWFSNCDKSNSMVNDNELESKSLCGLFGNSFQLVLGHFPMRIIIRFRSISRPSSIGRTTPQKSTTAPAPAMSLTGAASGTCVTEISQTTFAMRLNCSLQ